MEYSKVAHHTIIYVFDSTYAHSTLVHENRENACFKLQCHEAIFQSIFACKLSVLLYIQSKLPETDQCKNQFQSVKYRSPLV